MGIIREYVREETAPSNVVEYRILVDEWNSLENKIPTDQRLEKMLNLYASIKIHEHDHNWDMEFGEEIYENPKRYELKKYSISNV